MIPLAVTGHRKPYKVPEVVSYALENIIQKARRWGFSEYRSGMALGVDQEFARLVLKNEQRLSAYIPFKGYEDTWPQRAKEEYYRLLSEAYRVLYVSGSGYQKWKLMVRNKVMIKDVSLVIAVWDGRDGSGTYQAVEYAKSQGIPIWHIQPDGSTGWLTSNKYD